MMRSEWAAAGIEDPLLREGYRRCRELNAAHGRTFFLATRLLAPDQRPPVHALYGFARYADDILDDLDPRVGPAVRARRLQRLSERLFSGGAHADDPLVAAVTHTARRYRISSQLFADFLASMRMDLTVTDYPDREALNRYMRGSAEAIGLQVLPILGTVTPVDEAAPYAAALGRAFQLTNFLRDVDEDLARGRVYLPADELAADGVDRELLMWCHEHRRTDPRVRRALIAQHHIARRHTDSPPPGSRSCSTAHGRAWRPRRRCIRRSWTASRKAISRSSTTGPPWARRDGCGSARWG
ncbi:phytoene synthase [Mycobacterium avium subsp. paratuberculosis S5]|nr:phytoene synthase [Mycobacterium avium subsp. paratuberculosis S5]